MASKRKLREKVMASKKDDILARRARVANRRASLPKTKQAEIDRLLNARNTAGGATRVVQRRLPGEPIPLSFAQQRLWFLDQLSPGSVAYNVPVAFKLSGRLNALALEQSFNETIKRHESLRTNFVAQDGEPVQVIDPARTLDIPSVCLSGLSEHAREGVARRLALEHSWRVFDLTLGPLLRATILQIGRQEYALPLTMHHIVSDGWSAQNLIREIGSLYNAFCNGEPSPLMELPIQYADYACWQRRWLQGEILESEIAYWKSQLNGVPQALNLPTDHRRSAATSSEGAAKRTFLTETLTEGVRKLSRKNEATLFVTLLASFQMLLSRYSGQEDIAVGTPTAGRRWPETEDLIGVFINTIVMRARFSAAASLHDILYQVKEVVWEAQAHSDLPFEKLVEELQPERSLWQAPLFQVMFVLQNVPKGELESAEIGMSELNFSFDVEKFSLTLSVFEEEERLACSFGYSTDLFEETTISRMLGHWRRMLEAIVENPRRALSDVSLLTEQELQQILVEWTSTEDVFPRPQCVHQLFEAQVERTPDNAAIAFQDRVLSYRELNRRANRLARYLRKIGVGPEARVAICVERSLEMVVGLLAVLKAGGAYVPLDPSYPVERLSYMLVDSSPLAALTYNWERTPIRSELAAANIPTIDLESDAGYWANEADTDLDQSDTNLTFERLAYVIYTSGTTGYPKGVMVTHRALSNHMLWMQEEFHFSERDKVLQKTPFSFDASVWEFYAPLLSGGALVMAAPQGHKDAGYIVNTIREEGITTLQLAPSLARLLLDEPGFENGRVLKRVFCGGEPLTRQMKEEFFAKLSADLCNLYGPTEATIDATFWRCERNSEIEEVPIGRPIANTRTFILDRFLNSVPIGVPGDLYIGGDGLATGYSHQAAMTAERFVPDHLSGNPGSRLYRTGDKTKYLPDGNIEYLGRLDTQIKIRGFRVELGEIEAALNKFEEVQQAVVIDCEEERGDRRLVAYITQSRQAASSVRDLQRRLKDVLPDYMIPSAWVFLDEIPLTPSGKVNRDALPDPGTARVDTEQSFVTPRTLIEEIVAGIWQEVLGAGKIARDDNFFHLGGHSLLATRVVSRLRESFRVELSVRNLFELPTLTEIAGHIEEIMRAGNNLSTPDLRALPRGDALPPSYAQQRLWFLDQLAPGNTAYNLPASLQMTFDLNAASLENSLSEVVRRHEALRTAIANLNGQINQTIQSAGLMSLPIADLNGLNGPAQATKAAQLRQEESLRPFDLSEGPLLRASLLRFNEQEHALLVTMHHIVSDGWSMGVFSDEAETLYRAFSEGRQSPLPELEIQYADYAQWQRQWLQGSVLQAELDYWKRELAGAPEILDLDTDHPRSELRGLRGADCPIDLPEDLSRSLREFSRREGATMFMTLMAAFQSLIWRYTRQEDILVGTPMSGRTRLELEGLIGLFANMVALKANFRGGLTFRQLLRQVKASALGAYAHQELPFDKLVEYLQPARSLGRNPLFQVILAFQNAPLSQMKMEGKALPSGTSGDVKFDLETYFWDTPAGLSGYFTYSPELFEEVTVTRMATHFRRLLEKVMADPDAALTAFTLLDEAERRQVVEEWNNTAVDFPSGACVHELFERQVEAAPDAIAVESSREQVSYRELNRRANRRARYLQNHGVGPEAPVAVLLDRSVEMIETLLAIAKAGGAYLPISLTEPPARVGLILENAQISTVVTTGEIARQFPESGLRIIHLNGGDHWSEEGGSRFDKNPVSGVTAENLFYAMYTSGSTGTPKGVCVTHRNVVRLVKGANYVDLNSQETFLQLAPISFDASTFEIWACLLNGARLALPDPEMPSLNDLGDLITRFGVTTLWLTAGLFHQMVDGNINGLSAVKQLLAGGESLSGLRVDKALAELNIRRLINGYGPTESTTFACCYQIDPGPARTSVPIGRPISNTKAYVLNEMDPAAIGERGELFIGGEGLARGYLRRPDLTAERFLPNPFSHRPGERLYKSGDRTRWLNHGHIEFLGRLDNQVKIRGFRIEPGEIEASLSRHPAVKEVTVVAREDVAGDKRLVAYVVARKGESFSSEELKNYLRQRLPEYMVPSVCVGLGILPLTPNGKIDKKALPAPDRALIKSEGAYAAPQNALQRQLVEIWEELLNIRPIGITDNFFELGGHSLLTVLLVTRIEERLGRRIPVAALFRETTIEQLSRVIAQESDVSSRSIVAPIQPHGANPPLFCPHAGGGHVLFYADLARHLGEDQPFYGLQNHGPAKELVMRASLEMMAAEYVKAVRTVQPVGPYRLGGWSMGGVIAFEMARQLQAQGQQVERLILIDAEAPSERPVEYNWAASLGAFVRDLGITFDNPSIPWSEFAALPPMGQLRQVWSEAKALKLAPSDLTLTEFRRIFDVFKSNIQALRRYAGGSYQGRVILFRAETPPGHLADKSSPSSYFNSGYNEAGLYQTDPMRGWGKWVGEGVEVYTVSGDHYSIIREPHVKALAEQLRLALQGATTKRQS